MSRYPEQWRPWADTPHDPPSAALNNYNGMKGPPCPNCIHWNPQVTYRDTPTGQVFDGIRCCHADDMSHDFSCFKLPAELSDGKLTL